MQSQGSRVWLPGRVRIRWQLGMKQLLPRLTRWQGRQAPFTHTHPRWKSRRKEEKQKDMTVVRYKL